MIRSDLRFSLPAGRPRRAQRPDAGEHLTDLQIADYIDNVVSLERRIEIEMHIEICTSCHNAVAVLMQVDEIIDAVFKEDFP